MSLAAGCPRHDVQVERAVPYGHGKVLDIYRLCGADAAAGTQPVVLLWHGVGPDERGVLEPLARATAALGLTVVVPDWRSDARDGGRAHLLSSVSFTQHHAPALLDRRGWPVHLEELPADHAGVVMTEHDPELGQCHPANGSPAIEAGQRSAHILQAASGAKGEPERPAEQGR